MVTTAAKPAPKPVATRVDDFAEPIVVDFPEGVLTDELLLAIAGVNDCWRLERNAEGALEINALAGLLSDDASFEIGIQLRQWATEGHVSGSSGGYVLPSGAARAPDAAWTSADRWQGLPTRGDNMGRSVPDLIVEVRSAGQLVSKQREKMEEWMAGGARLGWLIDPFTGEGEVWVYREGAEEPEHLERPESLSGEDVAVGLTVDLTAVWR